MYTIEYAYELADQYTAKTNGYTVIEINRWNHHPNTYIDYMIGAQALGENLHFESIDALVERLKELLND
jgi:hypothetical protein